MTVHSKIDSRILQNRVKAHSAQVTGMTDLEVPMRRETQSEKTTRLIGEIGFVVVFCLSGFTLTMFALVHMHMSKFLG
jgi:hypothetical protein